MTGTYADKRCDHPGCNKPGFGLDVYMKKIVIEGKPMMAKAVILECEDHYWESYKKHVAPTNARNYLLAMSWPAEVRNQSGPPILNI